MGRGPARFLIVSEGYPRESSIFRVHSNWWLAPVSTKSLEEPDPLKDYQPGRLTYMFREFWKYGVLGTSSNELLHR